MRFLPKRKAVWEVTSHHEYMQTLWKQVWRMAWHRDMDFFLKPRDGVQTFRGPPELKIVIKETVESV